MTTTHWLCFLAFLPFFITVIVVALLKVRRARVLKGLAEQLTLNPGNTAVEQDVARKLRDLA